MITTVTLTGADDSILPEQLFEISKLYPYVEWAILVSRKSTGQKRFPSMRWIEELGRLNNVKIASGKPSLNLSLHLCGSYVKELLSGNDDFIEDDLSEIWHAFSRVQINTHGEVHYIHDGFTEWLNENPFKEWIFQYDNVNTRMLELAIRDNVKCSALFDLSHGTGILPEQWPDLLPGIKCGYAGGLSPDNLLEQIKGIESIVAEHPIWIDMETKIRSFNDATFCLIKCKQVLEIAKPFIQKI